MKKTFKKLRELDEMIGGLYARNVNLKESKFGYAYKRFAEKNYFPVYKQYVELLTDIRIDNALEDPTTKALRYDDRPNSRGFAYSKEGLKKVIKAENELEKRWDEKEFEVEPFYVAPENLPPTLTEDQKEMMNGLLIEVKQ